MDDLCRKNLQGNLLIWFQAHGRFLPWRRQRSLYGTWVSEIMLQQTTVAAVIPYWENFMALFPDVQALAQASESEVLSSWSGLGYYRRARNLHLAARLVMDELGGSLPSNRKNWQALPGVGAYASGAIASIGLGERVPAVDANAKRVLSRWFYSDPVLAGNLRPKELEELASSMIADEHPGQWNEAVMELGATLCRAGTAQCAQCPVLDQCQAGLAGVALEIPPPKTPKTMVPIAMATLVVRQGDHLLLLPPGSPVAVPLAGEWELGRPDTSGLHPGFWTLPFSPWYLNTPQIGSALEDAEYVHHWLRHKLHWPLAEIRSSTLRMASFGHSITHYRLSIRTWEVRIPEVVNLEKIKEQNDLSFVIQSTDTPVSKLVTKSLAMFL